MVLGDPKTGKSELIRSAIYPPEGHEKAKVFTTNKLSIELEKAKINLSVWDTSAAND